MVDNTCIVCCLSYNVTTRRPWDLGCGHCICEQCFHTSKLAICVECRQPTNNPHLQYTLLRMLQPSSPTSFPIGCTVEDDPDEAPGTPHPSAPVMEVEPWEPDDAGSDAFSRHTSSSMHSSSTGSLRNHRLCHRTSNSTFSSSSSGSSSANDLNTRDATAGGPTQPHTSTHCSVPGAASFRRNTAPEFSSRQQHPLSTGNSSAAAAPATAGTSNIPVHALTFTSTWMSTRTLSLGVAATAAAARSSTENLCSNPNGNTLQNHLQEQQLIARQLLTSFPVEDVDLLDGSDDSISHNSTGPRQDDLAEPVQGQDITSEAVELPSHRALVMVQAAVQGCVGLVQHLMVPHVLFEHSSSGRPGWPGPGPSLLLATTSSFCRTWAAYSTAVAHTLGHFQHLQLAIVAGLGRILARFGLPHAGHLAAYCLATWVLGMLLYHWQLGLSLLPVVTAGLGLLAFGAMPGSSGGCLLWPAKLAGAVLAGDSLLLGMLGVAWQQLAYGTADSRWGSLYAQLLSSTPQVLLLALLLLWAQVVMEVVSQGWTTYRELSFASLVVRCWTVAAAGVLSTGSAAAALATAIPWVQKAHLLLEGPVVVHHVGLLLQPSSTCWISADQQQQQMGSSNCASSSRAAAVGSFSVGSSRVSSRSDSYQGSSSAHHGGNGSVSALLMCVHFLLQLLLLLFVPPMPLAAAPWLPMLLRGGLEWAARVLLCGCIVQLLLHLVQPNGDATAVGSSSSPDGEVYVGLAASSSRGSRHNASCRPGTATAAAAGCGSGSGAADSSYWRSASPIDNQGGGCNGASCHSTAMLLGPGSPARSASLRDSNSRWNMQLRRCDSHALTPTSYCGGNNNNDTTSNHALATLPAEGLHSTGFAGVLSVVKQHAAYLGLLLLAAAGDAFIMAVPSAAAAGAVRAAWHMCVQQMLVVMFAVDVGSAAWREVQLLRQHQYADATRYPGQRLGGTAHNGTCAAY